MKSNKNLCNWLPPEYEKLRWDLYTKKINKMKQNKTVEVTEKWLNSLVEHGNLASDLLLTLIDNQKLTSKETGILSRIIGHAQSAEHLLPHCEPERDLHGDIVIKPNQG